MNTHHRLYSKHSKHTWAARGHGGYRGGYRRYSRQHARRTSDYYEPAEHIAMPPAQSLHLIGPWA